MHVEARVMVENVREEAKYDFSSLYLFLPKDFPMKRCRPIGMPRRAMVWSMIARLIAVLA